MYRCFELARKGAGYVAPNPMVGAVLVHNNVIIGEGYHAAHGQAHAEVNCINNVPNDKKVLISQSTLYVSLEPCAHFGKTPPCADLIITNKIPKVVIGCKDSFDKVDGKGIAKLKAAGVEVVTGVLEQEALALNERFFTFHTKKRPFIILKWAQTADKKIAAYTGERLLISNALTNRLVHRWRSEEAAVLVGGNTALKDDPALTVRLVNGRNPVRLVIDRELQLPPALQLFNGSAATMVFNYKKEELRQGVHYCRLQKNEALLPQLLHYLYNHKLQSVIVEGGAAVLQLFINAGLWDEARIITNTALVIGEGLAAPVLQQHRLFDTATYNTDTIEFYKNNHNG
jgi:diaminohydroxyphosphoribosylaminopyrimidine deaminase / 5-amino-6-(5-phosphoribosylamino)uracil reductase